MNYVARFKVATLEIYYLNKFVAILSIKRGMHPFQFTFLLDKTFPKSYSEFLTCIQKYIHEEEGTLSRQEAKERPQKK